MVVSCIFICIFDCSYLQNGGDALEPGEQFCEGADMEAEICEETDMRETSVESSCICIICGAMFNGASNESGAV